MDAALGLRSLCSPRVTRAAQRLGYHQVVPPSDICPSATGPVGGGSAHRRDRGKVVETRWLTVELGLV